MNEKKQDKPNGGKQTDAAEGDRQTVEESIRAHEEKGDAQGQQPKTKTSEKK